MCYVAVDGKEELPLLLLAAPLESVPAPWVSGAGDALALSFPGGASGFPPSKSINRDVNSQQA